MKDRPPRSSQTVVKILLALCSISIPATLFLLSYFFHQRQQIEGLKAQLLSESQLQAELLARQPLDHALMPHLVEDIGYVLNPFMKRASFHAAEGESYPVNWLGLRGPQIKAKKSGVTRILIVGDSIVFGWKLREKDRLSSILNRRTHRLGSGYEFLTIAMPGWNVRSQRAFLETHLMLLDPDLILWWSIGNDIEDTPGVIPPGTLASWASSQDVHQSPFVHLGLLHKRGGAFMPSLADRFGNNVRLIASFQQKFDIPIVILEALSGFSETENAGGFDPPWIYIPRDYKTDGRWRVAPTDGHPSAWANQIIAVGILRKLKAMGVMPEYEFKENDRDIVDLFDAEERKRIGSRVDRKPPDYIPELSQIPTEYRAEDALETNSVLYGISRRGSHRGEMSKAGTLFLRDPGHSSNIVIRFSPPPNVEKFPGAVEFTVTGRDRGRTRTTVIADTERIEAELPLPSGAMEHRVYEVSWLADYVLCSGPSACTSGKLLSAKFD